MSEAHNKDKIFRDILEDVGISDQLSEQCICCFESRDKEQLLHHLSEQRRELLDNLHSSQERLDCLDFLAYKIKNDQWR